MALQFDIIIVTEDIEPPFKEFFGFFDLAVNDRLRDLRTDAAARGDQALMVFFDQFLVYPRELPVPAIDIAKRTKLGKVFVPFLVFGQHQLVVADIPFTCGFNKTFFMPVLDKVEFAADDGFQVALVGFRHKFECAEHISVVGERDCLLAISCRLVHHRPDLGGAVKE